MQENNTQQEVKKSNFYNPFDDNVVEETQKDDLDEQLINENTAKIKLKVIGIGGAGNNAVQMMELEKYPSVEFIVANTDAQALAKNKCPNKLALGKESRGLGAGSDPEVGQARAKESSRKIEEKLKDADVVIITAGLGGGTGTGAAPVVAEIARNNGALTIAIVTTPFSTEGRKRTRIAKEGIEKLKEKVDSYIVLSNERLLQQYGDVPIDDAYTKSNVYLKNIINTIHDILYRIGTINIDFADMRRILEKSGLTLIGLGQASGKNRATKAVEKAFQNNLYSTEICGAERFLINIQYDKSATLNEIKTAVDEVNKFLNTNSSIDEDDIIIGQERIEGETDLFKVSVIAGRVIERKDIEANKIATNVIEEPKNNEVDIINNLNSENEAETKLDEVKEEKETLVYDTLEIENDSETQNDDFNSNFLDLDEDETKFDDSKVDNWF